MNNKPNNRICLYIEPHVHVNIKRNGILLYNTLTGEHTVSTNGDHGEIAQLLKRMTAKKNLNAVIVNARILSGKSLGSFLRKARDKQMINWYGYSKADEKQRKPVSIPAILNLHRDRKIMALDPERNPGEDIKNYLHKITIHVNCYQGAPFNGGEFTEAYKQFPYPYALNKYNELKVSRIKRFLDQIKDLQSFSLSVLGGNILEHKEFEQLAAFLGELRVKKELGLFYRDITADGLETINAKIAGEKTIRVFVPSKFGKETLLQCMDTVRRSGLTADYQFTVQDEADMELLDEILPMLGGAHLFVKPFYNGRNLTFFKKLVFIQRGDLSDPVVSKKDIYARSVMNTNSFGTLTILSGGDVYANLYEKRVGTIDGEVHEILLSVMSRGDGWFRVRKNLVPCKSCVYNHVCPPVSNYEYALSRNNLCNIYRGPAPTCDGNGG